MFKGLFSWPEQCGEGANTVLIAAAAWAGVSAAALVGYTCYVNCCRRGPPWNESSSRVALAFLAYVLPQFTLVGASWLLCELEGVNAQPLTLGH